MMGVWSYLCQFMYTKFIVVVDDDVNVRDTMLVENTPIDYLDFVSPASGLGSKMGLVNATNKWPGETPREWGRTFTMDAAVQARMHGIFATLDYWRKSTCSTCSVCTAIKVVAVRIRYPSHRQRRCLGSARGLGVLPFRIQSACSVKAIVQSRDLIPRTLVRASRCKPRRKPTNAFVTPVKP